MKKYLFLILLVMMSVSVGCEKKGPLEKAGEKLDEGIKKTGEKIDEGVQKVDEKIDDVKKDDDKPHIKIEGHL